MDSARSPWPFCGKRGNGRFGRLGGPALAPKDAFLDPLADKLLINVGFLLLAAKRDLPVTIPDWVTVIVLGRDIIIVAGVWFVSQFHGPLKFEPRILSKITTCFQMASLLSVMLALGLSMPLLYATSGITVLSGADYILAGSKKISEPAE